MLKREMFFPVFGGGAAMYLFKLTGNIIGKSEARIQCDLGYSFIRLQQLLGKLLHSQFENVFVHTCACNFQESLFKGAPAYRNLVEHITYVNIIIKVLMNIIQCQ